MIFMMTIFVSCNACLRLKSGWVRRGLKKTSKSLRRENWKKVNTVWRVEMSYMVWSSADRKLTCIKYGKLVSGLLSCRLWLMADLQSGTSTLSSSTSFYNFNALKLLIVPVTPAVLRWQKILVGVFPSNQLLNRFFQNDV